MALLLRAWTFREPSHEPARPVAHCPAAHASSFAGPTRMSQVSKFVGGNECGIASRFAHMLSARPYPHKLLPDEARRVLRTLKFAAGDLYVRSAFSRNFWGTLRPL